ncbi:MAG TPA: hypothetical protein VF375_07460 [Candidatus Limnocylindrales bacterium]
MRPLSAQAYNQRRDDLYSRFNRLGRVELQDLGSSLATRKLVIDVFVPGQADAIPDEAHFRYQEWWRRSALGWQRIRYDYDYFDLAGGARRGYHLHPLRVGEAAIPHAICEPADGAGAGRHYTAHEVDLLAAHEEFEAQYASGRPIDCRGLRTVD